MAQPQRFLRPELLGQLKTMELRAASVVEGVMNGIHRSPFRGLSVEFAEYRQYQPGDEISRVDWKAYARSDKFYIKECEDETNLDCWVLIDTSGSMNFGTSAMTKWQYGATLAASLAFLLQKQKDGIGLMILDEEIRCEMQTRATRGHLIQVIGQLEKTVPERKTRLGPLLHQAASRLKRKSMVILISDLLDEWPEVLSGLQHLQFGGNDVLVFQPLDRAELNFAFDGARLFLDPESNEVVPSFSESVREEYLEAMHGFVSRCREDLGRTNMMLELMNTAEPLDAALLSFLMRRRRCLA